VVTANVDVLVPSPILDRLVKVGPGFVVDVLCFDVVMANIDVLVFDPILDRLVEVEVVVEEWVFCWVTVFESSLVSLLP
jgi:hypothetical protein